MESTTQLQNEELVPIDDQLPEVSEVDDEIGIKFDRPLRGDGNERLLEVWTQLDAESDPGMLTAILLTGAHYFNWATTKSNEINDRQGKNRVAFNNDQRTLMNYSIEDNYDTFVDRKLNDLFEYMLSTYLLSKQVLPENKPRLKAGIESRVKALYIMLFATGNYGVIPNLNTPYYVQSNVDSVFEFLETEQENILNLWISYLEQHESDELAEVVRSLGRRFWGSDYVTAENSFNTKFHGMIHKFKNYQTTYDAYLEFREMYIKVTRSIPRNSLFPIFDITPKAYENARLNIINELQQLFTEDENAIAIQKLIYEY